MTKPAIDWTRPLRTVGGKHSARVLSIDPADEYPVKVEISEGRDAEYIERVDRNGAIRGGAYVLIENVPPEPRIVERWTVLKWSGGYYFPINSDALDRTRTESDERITSITRRGHYRIARVLIDEPGE